MKIATLGSDDQVLELADWIARSDRHQLVACLDLAQDSAALLRVAPQALTQESWETLLAGSLADAVLVAGRSRLEADRQRRLEQLRRLVQAAVPLVLVHPACEMIEALELEMIRRDSRCVMIPYHRAADHPGVLQLTQLAQAVTADGPGRVEQIVWEREAASRDSIAVLDHLARDALLLRRMLHEVTQVSALGTSTSETPYANLGVMLTGSSQQMVRWSIGPVQSRSQARITLVGPQGRVTLETPDSGADYRLSPSGSARQNVQDSDWHPAQAVFQRLEAQLGSGCLAPVDDWDEACRALEIVEAVERSHTRGRAIQLHHEQVSEEDTFKGLMAMGGCGMLLWVLLMLLIAAVVEGLRLPLRDTTVWRLWPAALFSPLVVFLLAQLLRFVFAKDKEGS